MPVEVTGTGKRHVESIRRKQKIKKTAMKEALEFLVIGALYFSDITEKGVEIVKIMTFLGDQGLDSVFSESYMTSM